MSSLVDFNISQYIVLILCLFPVFIFLYIVQYKDTSNKVKALIFSWFALCIWSISYQNSFIIDLNPGFYISPHSNKPSLTSSEFHKLKQHCFGEFTRLFDYEQYSKLSDSKILSIATIDSEKQLTKYGLNIKSNLTKIKTLSGLPRLFGLAYGGIAYHDLFTGEIVIPSPSDYPSSIYFRVRIIYHEVGHSLYYSNDIQNNIFHTQAMLCSSNPTIRSLAYLMILEFTDFPILKNLKMKQPQLYQEIVEKNKLNRIQLANYRIVNTVKRAFKKAKLQNNSKKYGYDTKYLNNIYLRDIHSVLQSSLLYLNPQNETIGDRDQN